MSLRNYFAYCCCCSVVQSSLTLCDSMSCSMPGLLVLTIVQSFSKLISIQPSHPLSPLLLLPSIFPSIRVFSNESVLCIRQSKYWSGVPLLSPKESWALKNWCFWTVVLEKTLQSPLDCKEIKPVNPKKKKKSVLNIHWKDWLLKLKLQYFGHLMWRMDSLEKTLMLGKTEGRRRRGDRGWDGWMASLTQWTWVWVNSGSWWWTGRPGVRQSMRLQRVRHNWATKLNWTELIRGFFQGAARQVK